MNSQFFSGKHSSGRVFPVNGAPKPLNHKETVEKLKICKAERQRNRERNSAALIIQSTFRDFISRRDMKLQLRLLFDQEILLTSYPDIIKKMKSMPEYYNEKLDGQRLKVLGNLMLSFASRVKEEMQSDHDFLMAVINFLVVSLKDLMHNSHNNSLNLRLLQEFGKSKSTITDVIIKRSKLYKISYYHCLHNLMTCQITLELMSTFLDFIVDTIVNGDERDDGINYLFNEMLGGYSDQTSTFHQQLLKLLCNHKSKLLLLPKTLASKRIKKSIITFHAIFTIFENTLGAGMPEEHELSYMLMLSNLSDCIVPRYDDEDSDSDEDDVDDDDIDNADNEIAASAAGGGIHGDDGAVAREKRKHNKDVGAGGVGKRKVADSSANVQTSKNVTYFTKAELIGIRLDCITLLNCGEYINWIGRRIQDQLFQGHHLYAMVKVLMLLLCEKRIDFLRQDIFDVFNCSLMRRLWGLVSTNLVSTGKSDQKSTSSHYVVNNWFSTNEEKRMLLIPLNMFSQMYDNLLFTMQKDDYFLCSDFGRMHFNVSEIDTITNQLVKVALAMIDKMSTNISQCEMKEYKYTFRYLCKLIRHLYTLDKEKHFYDLCWVQIAENDSNYLNMKFEYFSKEMKPPYEDRRLVLILEELPFLISFEDRHMIFNNILSDHREISQQDIMQNIRFDIHRSYVYEDTFSKFQIGNVPDPHKRIRVHMYSQLGLEEIGIDGGGVLQEFCDAVIMATFDSNRGLFKYTVDNMMYPSPEAVSLYPDFREHYYFIGRFLAKMMFDGMLLSLPLAHFFVSKILTDNHLHLDHLALLDPPFYKNLTELRYQEDISSLCLFFTVDENNVGVNEVIELKPNGRNIPVTKDNVIKYIHLMADYHLNIKIKNQCDAFKSGFNNCIPLVMLKMFDSEELIKVFGGEVKRIDLDDLERNTKYNGLLNPSHPVVILFWQALRSFDDDKLRRLLKFVTSSSRPPLMGFKELEPPFMIQNGGDESRLPSSSTCMHILKLPKIMNFDQMISKLTYAIDSGSGFELS